MKGSAGERELRPTSLGRTRDGVHQTGERKPRAWRRLLTLHEPEDTWLDSEELTYFRFMVPMRDKKGVQATHEPERRAPARRGMPANAPTWRSALQARGSWSQCARKGEGGFP